MPGKEIQTLTELDQWLKERGLEATIHNTSFESDQRIAGDQVTISITAGGFVPWKPMKKTPDILEITKDLLYGQKT